ncbi:4-alpha-glucanotransferase [Peptococcaceae bacterium]|nr:4-alpha-glucanotransferase [Peptococcaceae bacterium]
MENRSNGILLHISSLPSKYGIGDVGYEAYEFIDFLKEAKQRFWQILPLNPVGYGYSPYQTFSAFAGSHLFISIDKLIDSGLITKGDVEPVPKFDKSSVEFEKVVNFKMKVFRKAFELFDIFGKGIDYIDFVEKNGYWIKDYALFMALKNYFNGAVWNEWDKRIAMRREQAIEYYASLLKRDVEFHYFLQYTFFKQWNELKKYANENGVKIIGDMPIYVSYDSSDVWANAHLFKLKSDNTPISVAGVPPDYFSKTGQLWGNPIYDWSAMERDNFKWWVERFKLLFDLVDVIRIDHFIGFKTYWEIPAGEKTAVNGKWVKASGEKLFSILQEEFDDLPVIAEDLGTVTPEIIEFRKKLSFPGMKVLQFAFESAKLEDFLPYYHERDMVIYTATHDNDTTLGWFKKIISKNNVSVMKVLKKYFGITEELSRKEICWKFIEIAYQSMARAAIVPMQDILCLGSSARMNCPGTVGNNWKWRLQKLDFDSSIANKLIELTVFYNRLGSFPLK